MSAPTLPPVRPWRHELGGCLHAVTATLLAAEGVEPDHVLGAGWSFWYRNGDVAPAEYYFPSQPGRSLVEAVAPESGVISRWHEPDGPAWDALQRELDAGHLVAVAVDNFYLPFRPAFHDVHANHLIVLTGIDRARDAVHVMDRVPPAFTGWIRLADLALSRGSANPASHERDMFFTDQPIGNRWLSVCRTGPALPLTPTAVTDVIRRNLSGYVDAAELHPTEFSGLVGIRGFLSACTEALRAKADIADELFVIAGTALAATAVHADWLRTAAAHVGRPDLTEAARAVDLIAHQWSAVRILAALSRKEPSMHIRIARRADRLVRSYEDALSLLCAAVDSERDVS